MATQGQDQNDQDQRVGGYGGSTSGQDPTQDGGAEQKGSSAGGREGPITDAVDGDEAMGNRTGAYGGNPSSVDEPQNGQPD